MPFYQLHFDDTIASQWFLSGPTDRDGEEIDPRAFTEGRPYVGPRPHALTVLRHGAELDFSFGSFDMPVVRHGIADVLEELCGPGVIERFPVRIDGAPGFEVLNAANTLDCFDYANSVYQLWPEDSYRPEKAGQLQMVVGMRIDDERAAGSHLFRVDGWRISLIVSSRVKEVLEARTNGLVNLPA